MSKTLSRVFLLLLALASLASAQVLLDQARLGREIDVRCLYPAGTYTDYGALFPLVLEYHNKTLAPQTFELSWSLDLKVPAEYKTIVLEPGAKKRIPFLLPHNMINQLYSLEVNDQNVPVTVTQNSQGRVTGVLTGDGENLDYLRSLQLVKNPYYNPANQADGEEYNTPQALSSLDEEVFPDHFAALTPLKVLICYDLTSLNLGDTQYQAMVNWVRQGGELVLVSNGIPTEYRGTPLEEILPMKPESVVTRDERVRVAGKLRPGAISLVGDPGEELLLERSELNGKVYYLTVPLLNTEILGKGETEALWRFVFDKQPVYNNSPHTFALLDSIPELPRTQAGWVALFVILYGIIVGPVNLSILRKRDKMLWSFVTVPLVAIFFAGSAYVVNRLLRPSTPVLRELGYMSIQAGEQVGFAESEQLLFSPDSKRFVVRGDNATVFEITGYRYSPWGEPRTFGLYEQTAQGGLESPLEMGTWDIQRFQARTSLNVKSPFEISILSPESLEITAPIAGAADKAVVYLPAQGASEAFTLVEGKQKYDLKFTGAKPADSLTYDDELHPGREELLNQLHNTRVVTTGKLYFYTETLQTPLSVDDATLTRHDYLVCVEFPVD